jgi:hypothetical protein
VRPMPQMIKAMPSMILVGLFIIQILSSSAIVRRLARDGGQSACGDYRRWLDPLEPRPPHLDGQQGALVSGAG